MIGDRWYGIEAAPYPRGNIGLFAALESCRIVKEEQGTAFRLLVRLPPLLEADANRYRDGDHGYDGDHECDHRASFPPEQRISPGCDKQPGGVSGTSSRPFHHP